MPRVYGLSFASAFVVAPVVSIWVYGSFGPSALGLRCGAAGVAVALEFMALGRRKNRDCPST